MPIRKLVVPPMKSADPIQSTRFKPSLNEIAVLDIEKLFFHDIEAKSFDYFKEFIGGLCNSGVLWITGAGQINCKDPRYAMSLGVARTLRTEMELDIATLEVESLENIPWDTVSDVF